MFSQIAYVKWEQEEDLFPAWSYLLHKGIDEDIKYTINSRRIAIACFFYWLVVASTV